MGIQGHQGRPSRWQGTKADEPIRADQDRTTLGLAIAPIHPGPA